MRITVFGILILGLVAPVAADWLVLHDGTRLETSGPWKEKGRQVIYTGANGALSALRLADVDLEASRAATEEKAIERQAPPQPAPATQPSRARALVLTDKDIPAAAANEPEEETEADAEDEAGIPESTEPVELVTWSSRESPDVDGLEIIGTVRNRGDDIAAAIRIAVSVSDENGDPVLETRAFLQRASLAPGQSTQFKAPIPGVYTLFGDPEFVLTSDGFSIQGPDPGDQGEPEDELLNGDDPALESESFSGG